MMREVLAVTGAVMMVRASTFAELGASTKSTFPTTVAMSTCV